MLKRWLLALASAIPPLLVVAVIAVIAYWGHTNEWKAPPFRVLLGAEEESEPDYKPAGQDPTKDSTPGPPDWCAKHAVADTLCTACHPEIPASKFPALPASAELTISPSHKPEECRTHLEVIKFPSAEALKNSGVQVEPAREQTLTDTVTAYAAIDYDPDYTFKLSPRAGGTVWRMYKQLGETVRAGEVVALIESADIGKAKAEYLQAAVQFDTRGRALKMLQSGSPPERMLQEADSAVREAKARLFTAQQALLNFGLPLKGDEASLADEQLAKRLQFLGLTEELVASMQTNTTTANLLPLISPRAGQVIERLAQDGETVSALNPMFVISAIAHVHAHVDFRPEDVARVTVGMPVEFTPDSGGRPATGRLAWIATAVGEKTRLVHARVELDNPDGRLRVHLFGTATVTVATHENAVVVPADAVQWEGCSHVVFVRHGELEFRPRKVRLGLRQNGTVEVLAGLRPGEVVATVSSRMLKSYLFRDRLGAPD